MTSLSHAMWDRIILSSIIFCQPLYFHKGGITSDLRACFERDVVDTSRFSEFLFSTSTFQDGVVIRAYSYFRAQKHWLPSGRSPQRYLYIKVMLQNININNFAKTSELTCYLYTYLLYAYVTELDITRQTNKLVNIVGHLTQHQLTPN